MTTRSPFRRVWLAGILLLCGEGAQGQQTITAQVVGSGGGTTTDGRLAIHGTFGQQIVGRTAADGIDNAQGFWRMFAGTLQTVSAPTTEAARTEAGHTALAITPNPSSISTDIRFTILREEKITLTLYDLLGRHVATLLDERRSPGQIAVTVDAAALPSGSYTVALTGRGIHHSTILTVAR